MDSSIVTSLNHWFAGSDTKIEIVKFLTLWPLIGVLAVVLFIWWISGNQPAGTTSSGNATTTTVVQQTSGTHTAAPAKNTATDVVSVAAGISNGTIFSSWLKSTGVASELTGAGPYTLFLPTDAAIGQLTPGTFKNLSAAAQKRFVENHIISGKVINVEAQVAGSFFNVTAAT